MEGNPVVTPIDTGTLYFEDKSKGIEAVNVMKDKRCVQIKGRTCADDNKQKGTLKK